MGMSKASICEGEDLLKNREEEIEEGEIVESLKKKSKKKKKGKKRRRHEKIIGNISRRSSIELIQEEMDRVKTQVEDIKQAKTSENEERTVTMVDSSALETTLDSSLENIADLA